MSMFIRLVFISTTNFVIIHGYARCWDNVNPDAYSGTINTTPKGNTCQYWSSSDPQSHGFTSAGDFPLDGSVAAAKNYCRSPDNEPKPWCYTTNPSDRFELCDIPVCTEYPCAAGDTAGLASPGLNTGTIGGNTGINYLLKSATTQFSCCGTVGVWHIYVQKAGTIRMQVWRPQNDGAHLLIGENVYSFSSAQLNTLHSKPVLQVDRISIRNGDLIGWYMIGIEMLPYDSSGLTNDNIFKTMAAPSIGQQEDFSTGSTTINGADYSVGADITLSISPYFTNTLTTITVPQSKSVGSTVLELLGTDDDVGDRTDLLYLFEESDMFIVNPGSRYVLVRTTLVANSYTLTARVVDRCNFEGTMTFTFEVVNEPPAFTNWQSSATTEASSTLNGQTITKVTVTDPESDPVALTLTCTACPFAVNNDGVITATQNLLLEKTPSYAVQITANDGTNTVTSTYLTIYITNINAKPTFSNIPTTVAILETVGIGTEVKRVSSNDANGDTVSYSATTFSPVACGAIYAVDSTTGAVTTLVKQDSETATLTSCDVTITGYDGRENSDPQVLTLTLQSTDEAPELSSSTFSATVPEFSTGQTLAVTIAATDPEGSAVTYSRSCGAQTQYVNIDASSAAVTLVPTLDLDILRQETFTITCSITAADAGGKTSVAVLTITVTDANDNSPVFNTPAQTITIHQSTSAGQIGSAMATDFDTTSPNNFISYSIAGSSKFTVDAAGNIFLTGDVSGDPSITPYSLVVTATDGGGQTATANVQVLVTEDATNIDSSTFFNIIGNIIWFSFAMFLLGLMAALLAYLLCRYCRKRKRTTQLFKMSKPKPRNQISSVNPYTEKSPHMQLSANNESGKKDLYLANASHLIPGKVVPFISPR